MIRTISLSLVPVFLAGCATTTYQKATFETRGMGYSEKRTTDGVYWLTVSGGELDGREKLQGFWNRRAGELCGVNNFEGSPEKKTRNSTSMAYMNGVLYPASTSYPFIEGRLECLDKNLARKTGPAKYNPDERFKFLTVGEVNLVGDGSDEAKELENGFRKYVESELERYRKKLSGPVNYRIDINIRDFTAKGWSNNVIMGGISGGTYKMSSVVNVVDLSDNSVLGQREFFTETYSGGSSEYRLKSHHAREIVEFAATLF